MLICAFFRNYRTGIKLEEKPGERLLSARNEFRGHSVVSSRVRPPVHSFFRPHALSVDVL